MFLKRSKQTLILGSILSLLSINCAQANDLGDLLQSWVGNGYSNFNNLSSGHQISTINNIQNRITQLRSDANVAVQSGQISHNEFINMNAELDRISNMSASYSANGMTFGEAQALIGMLDTAAARLTNYGYGNVSQFPNYNPRPGAYGFANINERQAFIQRRIDQGVRNGRLNRFEADNLRAQLNRIGRDEANMRLGGLSGWERQKLLSRLDNLNNRVTNELNDGQIAGRRNRWY